MSSGIIFGESSNTDTFNTYFSPRIEDRDNYYIQQINPITYSGIDFGSRSYLLDNDIDGGSFLCNIERLLFDAIEESVSIDLNQDRTEFKKLKLCIRNSIVKSFKSFIDRDIIEDFNITKIYSDGIYIYVKFDVIRNNKLYSLSKRFMYLSTNYGLK